MPNIKKKKIKKMIKEYLIVNVGLILCAVAFNLFFEPLNIVIGDSGGVSIIIHRLFGMRPSITIFVIYIVMFIISLFFLKRQDIIHSLYGTFAYPIFIELFKNIRSYIEIDYNEYFVAAVFGGILLGLGLGLIYRTGFTTGGFDVLIHVMEKKMGLSMGTSGTIINATILLLGVFIFGFTQSFYALIIIYIVGVLTDRVVLGIHDNKTFTIITNKEDEVKEYIHHILHYNATIMDGTGGYTQEPKKVLMCVVPTIDYYRLKEGIQLIDPTSFVLVSDAYEIRHQRKRVV